MRVRVQNLLGSDVYTAAFVEFSDELSDSGGTKQVLKVDSPEPLHLESYSSDEIEIVESTPEEDAQLAAHGFADVQRKT